MNILETFALLVLIAYMFSSMDAFLHVVAMALTVALTVAALLLAVYVIVGAGQVVSRIPENVLIISIASGLLVAFVMGVRTYVKLREYNRRH